MDDLDFDDFGNDEFPVETDGSTDSRKPVASKIKSTGKEILNDFKDSKAIDQIQEVTEGIIPKVLGDDAVDAVTGIKDALKESSMAARETGSSLFDKIAEMSDEDSFIGSIANKVADAIRPEYTTSATYTVSDDEKASEYAKELLGQQETFTDTQSKLFALQTKATSNSTKLLLESQANQFKLSRYGTVISERYYKKSLELKYRHILESKIHTKIMQSTYDALTTQLKNIEHNTALPDVVKAKSMEALHARFRSNVADNIYNTFGVRNNWIQKLGKNIKRKGDAIFQGLQQGFSSAEELVSMQQQTAEMGGGATGAMISGMGRGFLGGFIGNKLMKTKIGSKIKNEIGSFKISPSSYFHRLEGKTDNSFLSKLYGSVANLTSGEDSIQKLDLEKNDLDEATSFDNRTKESINIVPSLLGNILNEVTAIRTGSKPDKVKYDHTTHEFVSTKNYSKTIKKEIGEGLRNVGTANRMRAMFNDLDKSSSEKLSTKDKETLSRRIYKRIKDDDFSLRHLDKNDKLFKGLSEKNVDKYHSYLISAQSKDGVIDNKAAERFEAHLGNISRTRLNVNKRIESLIKSGFTSELLEAKLIKYNKLTGEYTLNDKVFESMTASALSKMLNENMDNFKKEVEGNELKDKVAVGTEKFIRKTKRRVKAVTKIYGKKAKETKVAKDIFKKYTNLKKYTREELTLIKKDIYDMYGGDIEKAEKEWVKFKENPSSYTKDNVEKVWNSKQVKEYKEKGKSLYRKSKTLSKKEYKKVKKEVKKYVNEKYIGVKEDLLRKGYDISKIEDLERLHKEYTLNPGLFKGRHNSATLNLISNLGVSGMLKLNKLYKENGERFTNAYKDKDTSKFIERKTKQMAKSRKTDDEMKAEIFSNKDKRQANKDWVAYKKNKKGYLHKKDRQEKKSKETNPLLRVVKEINVDAYNAIKKMDIKSPTKLIAILAKQGIMSFKDIQRVYSKITGGEEGTETSGGIFGRISKIFKDITSRDTLDSEKKPTTLKEEPDEAAVKPKEDIKTKSADKSILTMNVKELYQSIASKFKHSDSASDGLETQDKHKQQVNTGYTFVKRIIDTDFPGVTEILSIANGLKLSKIEMLRLVKYMSRKKVFKKDKERDSTRSDFFTGFLDKFKGNSNDRDNDGDRDGSWMDILSNRKSKNKDKKSKTTGKKGKRDGDGFSIFSLLTSLITGGASALSMGGNVVTGILSAAVFSGVSKVFRVFKIGNIVKGIKGIWDGIKGVFNISVSTGKFISKIAKFFGVPTASKILESSIVKKGGKAALFLGGAAYLYNKLTNTPKMSESNKQAMLVANHLYDRGYTAEEIDTHLKNKFGTTVAEIKELDTYKDNYTEDSSTPPIAKAAITAGTLYGGKKIYDKIVSSKAPALKVDKAALKTAKDISKMAKVTESTSYLSKLAPKFLKNGKGLKLLKRLPGIGTAVSLGSAAYNLARGNYMAAGLDVLLSVTKASPIGMGLAMASMFIPDGNTEDTKEDKKDIEKSEDGRPKSRSWMDIIFGSSKSVDVKKDLKEKELEELKLRYPEYYKNVAIVYDKNSNSYIFKRSSNKEIDNADYTYSPEHNRPYYYEAVVNRPRAGEACGLRFVKHNFKILKSRLGNKKIVPKYITLHGTASDNLYLGMMNGKPYFGTQVWIERDGTIHIVNELDDYQQHIGSVDKITYVRNSNSIGIEVCQSYKNGKWNPITAKQKESLKSIVGCLYNKFNLSGDSLYYHGQLTTRKKHDEGLEAYNYLKGITFVDTLEEKKIAERTINPVKIPSSGKQWGSDATQIDRGTPTSVTDSRKTILTKDVNVITDKGVHKTMPIPTKVKPLLNIIAKYETNTSRSGYDTVYGGEDMGVSKMPIKDVYKVQSKVLDSNGGVSTAAGRYQFMKHALKETVKSAGISEDTIFSPNVQDYLITYRLNKKRGFKEWLNGGISDYEFAHNLSKEFASFPDPYKGGVSHYSGQKSRVSVPKVYDVLHKIKGTGSIIKQTDSGVTSKSTIKSDIPPELYNDSVIMENSNIDVPKVNSGIHSDESVVLNTKHIKATNITNKYLDKSTNILADILKEVKKSNIELKKISNKKDSKISGQEVHNHYYENSGKVSNGSNNSKRFERKNVTDVSTSGLRRESVSVKY